MTGRVYQKAAMGIYSWLIKETTSIHYTSILIHISRNDIIQDYVNFMKFANNISLVSADNACCVEMLNLTG